MFWWQNGNIFLVISALNFKLNERTEPTVTFYSIFVWVINIQVLQVFLYKQV
jgi:hypothetical protein